MQRRRAYIYRQNNVCVSLPVNNLPRDVISVNASNLCGLLVSARCGEIVDPRCKSWRLRSR